MDAGRKISSDSLYGAPSTPHPLLYADDVVLMAENRKEREEKTQRWKDQLGSYGLKLNTKKTEYMEVGGQTSESIYIDEKPIKKASTFT
ncbi:unnamed protein product [Strongylus vulgaris]|uniref:Reverse transcriptase domain-containing protein n=1 Tax=Strongylus vulgaris TaxID=40348 RepID=A0A3P7J8Z7_STRVU|nr:unnamed protein product [Strongylus vulgaris]